jgi:LAO/AO transport system kinase
MSILEDVLKRDVRAGARLIRWIDDDVGEARSILKKLYSRTGRAAVIGVTGNPGAGKSTLVDQLIRKYREVGKTVAVVAVDPSSPFSGGAILGDRIRMQEHALDEGVFIRSFATRGHLGGLTSTTADVVHVLDAMGWDIVLVETVGVGQDEVEVQRLAHTTVVMMAPGMGDEIQAIKAGILEIADVFVVNKADREGADRTVRELRLMLDMGKESLKRQQDRVCPQGWMPRVIKTVSTTGEGVDELMIALAEHRRAYEDACQDPNFFRARLRRQFLDIFRRTLFARGWSYLMHEDHLREIIEKLQDGSSDPYTLAEQAVNALGRF